MSIKNILLVLFVVGISFAGISVTSYTVSKDFFKPGEPGVATVTVTNPSGSDSVSSLTMSIDPSYELYISSAPRLADIGPGASTVVSIPFRVKDDARPGVYLLNVVFQGYVTDPTAPSRTSVNTISIPITIVNVPEFTISTDTSLLTGIDDVVLAIRNDGGAANNVRIRMTGSVVLYGADQIYLGTVSQEKNASISIDSRSAEDGAVSVPITVEYDDELGISHADDTTLRMTVRKEKLDLAFTQLSSIVTRKEGTLTLQMKNNGQETLKDVRLSFDGAELRLKDVNELDFGDLPPGGSATVSTTAFADMAPGLNLVASTVSWIERDIQREESRSVPITITSDADVGVFLEARPVPLTMGSEHTVSVLVSNLGSYRIDNVDVALSSPALRSLDVSDTQYIGGLQTDDFSTVQFTMQANSTAEGDYPVYITINYRDQSGEWKHRVITQTITVYSPVAPADNTLMTIVVLGLVVGAVWYFKFRKR